MIVLSILLLSSGVLFLISIWSMLISRQNIIVILLSIELMLLCLNFTFICISILFDDLLGVVFFFLLCLAGAEASLGLAILIIVYRLRGLISIYSMCYLKG